MALSPLGALRRHLPAQVTYIRRHNSLFMSRRLVAYAMPSVDCLCISFGRFLKAFSLYYGFVGSGRVLSNYGSADQGLVCLI